MNRSRDALQLARRAPLTRVVGRSMSRNALSQLRAVEGPGNGRTTRRATVAEENLMSRRSWRYI